MMQEFLSSLWQVTEDDLKLPDFSTASDLGAIMQNPLNMKHTTFPLFLIGSQRLGKTFLCKLISTLMKVN